MKHISDINLQRFLDGNLSFIQKLLCKHHLGLCEQCRGKLESLRQQRAELLEIAEDMHRLQEAETAITKTAILRK